MLRRIHIQGFKSLRDVDVELRPLVVVLGPNAAGKSNFLEAIDLLADMGTLPTLDEAFEELRGLPAEAFALPETGLRGLLAANSAKLSIEAEVETRGDEGREAMRLRYRVEVNIQPVAGSLTVTDEYLAQLTRTGTPKGAPRIERRDAHLEVRHRGTQGRGNQEPIGLHHTVLSGRQYAAPKFPEYQALRDEFIGWRNYYLEPREAMRAPQPPREVDDIGAYGEQIAPFLQRLKMDKQYPHHFEAFVRAVQGAIPSIESIDVALDERYGTLELQVVQEGTAYSSRVISEGTLRVIALCALAANPWPASLVAFEEPENGVHPRRLIRIAHLLGAMTGEQGRQMIVTTHSAEFVSALLRLVRDGEIERDRILFLRCSREDRQTQLRPIDLDAPLFHSHEVQEALRSTEDDVVGALMKQGWLDG